MTKYTKKVIDTFKLPVMTLKISVAGETKTFESTVAETILAQVRKVVVGEEQIQYYDVDENKFKSFTYCCGDKYEYSFTTKTFEVLETEKDCYGFPETYDDSVKGEVGRYQDLVKVKSTYEDHLADVRAKQFGKQTAVKPATGTPVV